MPLSPVFFFTKYTRAGASSRYRTYQYLQFLQLSGCPVVVHPLFDDSYLEQKYESGTVPLVDVLKALTRRVFRILDLQRQAVVVIEYELLPWFPAVFERFLMWRGCKVMVDYDDALFHQYDTHPKWLVRKLLGGKIASVMRLANTVMVGNQYLASYAKAAGAKRVELVPTVIDLSRYPTLSIAKDSGEFVIGWIGSPSTAKYLQSIAPALAELCKATNVKVRLVGSGYIDLPSVSVETVAWKDDTEVDEIRRFDVGIMPLPDEPWTRGKCGFKLIQYMACGLPVVASPVGVNAEIVSDDVNGFLATTTHEWVQALLRLKDDRALRQRMGQEGRKRIEEKYCLQVTAQKWVSLIEELHKPNQPLTGQS